jgi:hypothetical protein
MPLDYYVANADTGFNYKEAIQPVKNGEDANEDTFERPSENLRTRTEDVRNAFDLLEAVVASDRGLTVIAPVDAHVTWNSGTGKFVVDNNDSPLLARDFYLVPLLGLAEGSTGAPGTNAPATYVHYYTGEGAFVIETNATLRDHGDTGASRRSGANNVFIRVDESARISGGVVISVEGDAEVGPTFPADGPVTIVIEMESGGNTAAEIVAALATAGDHDFYINISGSATKVLSAGACTTEVTRRRFGDGNIYDDGGGNVYHSYGAMDPEGILVDSASLISFFAVSGNELGEGDVLAVNFTGADDRLNNQTDSSMTSMLKKLTSDAVPDRNTWLSERKHMVPICKVFDGNLYFLNGTMFESTKPGRLIPDPGDVVELKVEYDAHVAGTADQHADADVTAEAHAGTGNPGKTVLPVTLPGSSEVRTHIDELLKTVDRHMDGTVVAFKHPSGDVTTSAHSSSPRSLGATDLDTNLNDLLGFYNNHADGSADNHPVKDISNRPVAIVDGGGDGDYTTIAAALDAMKTTGGRVYVMAGTYTDAYDSAVEGSITAPIDVIGVGTAIWQSGGSSYAYKVSGSDTSDRVTFHNMHFKSSAGSNTPIMFSAVAGDNAVLRFVGCSFEMLSSASAGPMINVSNNQVIIEDSYFLDGDFTNRIPQIQTSASAKVRVSGCRFNGCGQIWKGVSSASDEIVFLDNLIEACGYTLNGSDVGWLFDGGAFNHETLALVRNHVTGFASSTNQARLVYSEALSGTIAGNRYQNSQSLTSPVAVDYCMHVIASNSINQIAVIDNSIDPGPFSGIHVEGAVLVSGNAFQNITPAHTTGYGVYADGDGGQLIKGNTIDGASISGYTGVHLVPDNVLCEGNTITSAGAGGWGIVSITGSNHRINGNTVLGDSTAAGGIQVGGVRSLISHNTIYGVPIGISILASCTVSNNYIRLTASGSVGINVESGNVVIIGNNLLTTVTNGTGIDITNGAVIYCTITSNNLYGWFVGIDLKDARTFVCNGNTVTAPDVNGSKGINAAQASLIEMQGAITGNTIFRLGDSNKTGSYGIDLTYCDSLEVSGNSIWPYEHFVTPIETTNAAGVGSGKNNTTPNTDTYNTFDIPA